MKRAERRALVHRVLNDIDYVSHKGTKDTKGFTAVETLCELCAFVRGLQYKVQIIYVVLETMY